MNTIGFIGLGVMGGPMCRNVALKYSGPLMAYDLDAERAAILDDTSAECVEDIKEIWRRCDIVMMSLPGSDQVESVCMGLTGVASAERKTRIVVDLSTTSVATARKLGEILLSHGINFADAPVARTRDAAIRGELAVMVGAEANIFKEISPLLHCVGTDIMHVGTVGSGQFIKLVNNALLDVNVIAIAEAMALAEKAGVDPAIMVEACAKGSGDSYALRHHAVTSMLPREFPEKSFPPAYKVKDLSYLIELAEDKNSPARSMQLALDYYTDTANSEYSGRYFTAVMELIARRGFESAIKEDVS